MTQRQQLHPVGTFPVCPTCGDELRHIHDARVTDGGHLLSCCCGDSPKFADFADLMDALVRACARSGMPPPKPVPARHWHTFNDAQNDAAHAAGGAA